MTSSYPSFNQPQSLSILTLRISQNCPLLCIANALVQAFRIFTMNCFNSLLAGIPHSSHTPVILSTLMTVVLPICKLCYSFALQKINVIIYRYLKYKLPTFPIPNALPYQTCHFLSRLCVFIHAIPWNALATFGTELPHTF